MSTLLKLAPLGVGLVVFAVVVMFLVQRNMAVGTWLIAAFLLGHGLVHVMFVAPPPVAAAVIPPRSSRSIRSVVARQLTHR